MAESDGKDSPAAPETLVKNASDEEEATDTVSPLYSADEDVWDAAKESDEKPQKRRTSLFRSTLRKKNDDTARQDHLQQLLQQKRASMRYVQQAMFEDTSKAISKLTPSTQELLTESKKKALDEDTMGLKDAAKIAKTLQSYYPTDANRVGVRLIDFSYEVNVDPTSNEIQTVYNQSCIYDALKWWKIMTGKEERPKKERKFVLQNVNLNFEPGKMYLVLGPPLSGKTTLLKAIAGRLETARGETKGGSVLYNGLELDVSIENFWFGLILLCLSTIILFSPCTHSRHISSLQHRK